MQEITVIELKKKFDEGDDFQLIDVRQPDEFALAKIEGAKLIPLGEIMQRQNEIDSGRDTVLFCRSGVRSAKAIQVLYQSGFEGKLSNLIGGILAWSDQIDSSIPKY